MALVIGFIGAVVIVLFFSFGLDFVEQFIPKRLFDVALACGIGLWVAGFLKWIIKDAVKEAIQETKED